MKTARPILIIGEAGLLGEALRGELARRRRPHTVPSLAELDLGREKSITDCLDRSRPGAVINAAAFTDVARAELPEHLDEVMRVNRDGPGWLAAACARAGLPLIHVSTDYVFDGRKAAPYREDDPVAPLQVYGCSKLAGERAVLEACPGALVARTSTLFGPGIRSRPHYVDAVLGQAERGGPLSLVRLPVSSPTYAPDLAKALLRLLDVETRGIVNVANSGACSRLELAREAIRLAGYEERVELSERPESPGGPARPAYSALDLTRYAGLAGEPPRAWQEALADYVALRSAVESP
jgi:dTDP-4-dehydrorhamnose reductase